MTEVGELNLLPKVATKLPCFPLFWQQVKFLEMTEG